MNSILDQQTTGVRRNRVQDVDWPGILYVLCGGRAGRFVVLWCRTVASQSSRSGVDTKFGCMVE